MTVQAQGNSRKQSDSTECYVHQINHAPNNYGQDGRVVKASGLGPDLRKGARVRTPFLSNLFRTDQSIKYSVILFLLAAQTTEIVQRRNS